MSAATEELPRPSDPELAELYDRERYEACLAAARVAVRTYPDAAAQVLAQTWFEGFCCIERDTRDQAHGR